MPSGMAYTQRSSTYCQPVVTLVAARPGTPACRPFPRPHVHDIALVEAAKVGDADAINSLVADGVDMDFPPAREDPYDMPVHFAATGNHAEALRALVIAGADVSRIGEAGTPLHMATKAGAIEAVNILLNEAGADADATDQLELTALIIAFDRKDNLAVVRALISAGADTNHLANVCDNGAFTPLRCAIDSDSAEAVDLLISAGASPNRPFYTRQLQGVTPVHWACRLARPDCLDVLLRRGGDPTLEEGGGVSLSDYSSRPAGLKPADVVGAGNPCEPGQESADPAARERILAALRACEERRSGWGRRKAVVMLRALRARSPACATVGGTEDNPQEHPEGSALDALQAVWEWHRTVAEDRREVIAAIKHNRTATMRRQQAWGELEQRNMRLEVRSYQGEASEELAAEKVKLRQEFDAFFNSPPEPRVDEVGARRRMTQNRELRQAAIKERGWAIDLERNGAVERLTRHGDGSLPAALFRAVMAYV